MKEILKLLGKHKFKLLFIIILLVLMAKCDLALPSYTSNIVNVGISQNGITDTLPKVITKSTYDNLNVFLSDEQLSNYKLIKKNDNKYIDDYPLLKTEDLYLLNSNNNIDNLKDTYIIMNMLISKEFNKDGDKTLILLKNMPKEEQSKFIKPIKDQIEKLGDKVVNQLSISFVKAEYENIGIDIESLQMSYIYNIGFKMLAVTLLSVLITIVSSYCTSIVSSKFSKDLRSKLVSKVMSFSNTEFDKLSASSLITRSTNDIQQVQMLVTMLFRIVIYAPIIGIGAFLKVKDSNMAWVIGVAIIAIFVVILLLLFLALPNFQKVQKLLDKINLVSREQLNGLQVIRAFATEKHEEKRFDKANIDLTKVNTFVNKVMAIMMPTMTFIMYGISILIIWVGADKVNEATIQIGDLMAFIQYAMQILTAFLMISLISIMAPRSIISLKRIIEVLNTKVSVKDKDKTVDFDNNKIGILEFKDVYFRYPDAEEDVLSNISFKVKKGETIAFIGGTGCGKSTLVNLIPRFFDVTSGKIIIDGEDIKNVPLRDLREKIGYVPQKGVLFSGSIKSNIKLGNSKLSDEELRIIGDVSQSSEFILAKEEGYNHHIAQGGSNVSGGQKQRLSIARAIAKKPEFYIFDDSFSALDFKTDSSLRKALKTYTKDSTTLIVAQRISSIMNADKIVVLEKGEIVGLGTHKELISSCSIYKEIALSQLGEEGIKNV